MGDIAVFKVKLPKDKLSSSIDKIGILCYSAHTTWFIRNQPGPAGKPLEGAAETGSRSCKTEFPLPFFPGREPFSFPHPSRQEAP